MSRGADAYYTELARDYDRVIRQLVPRYDEMLGALVDALEPRAPVRLLELGTGTGAAAARVLEALPGAHLSATDLSPAMLERAEARLARFGGRVRLARADLARDDAPEEALLDGAFTNLVLHNLRRDRKRTLLRALRARLATGAILAWGDMVTFRSPDLLARAVAYRRMFALEAGCDPELLRWNFEKEGTEDHPLTVEETMVLGREVGFRGADVTWAHDQFAVVVLEA
ncbi:MAG: class I SAM-dependent methyltransferase [Gemmatimonadetes bacterium]|nr:class I SAM-dependent methyltransferase [Gemmatimonadota bacterium]